MTKARIAEIRAKLDQHRGKDSQCLVMLEECVNEIERLNKRRFAPKFTLEEVNEEANAIGLNSGEPEAFFHHFNGRGWRYKDGAAMVSLRSALWTWKRNAEKFTPVTEKKGGFGIG